MCARLHVCVCVQVLPPLRDVRNKPEVGSALRNKLVRLMTHIDTDVKTCAAEFLFVLCKESGEPYLLHTEGVWTCRTGSGLGQIELGQIVLGHVWVRLC